MKELSNFYSNKKVFLTGHTGFKGAWMSLWLAMMGAKVAGFSLKPDDESLYNIANIEDVLDQSTISDIRNESAILNAIRDFQPEIIIHMAAQPLVRQSYFDPLETYQTNVIGTLNVFEAVRKSGSVKSILSVTTDKCYENREIDYPYKEDDPMGGYDPYSSSKACAEILTSSYRRSFLTKEGISIASARAGNVIGGGDFSTDRIIPDIFRSIRSGDQVELRSPNAIRPWQHVLEPLYGYLLLTQRLYENGSEFAKAFNFGPNNDAEVNVENLTNALIKNLETGSYNIASGANLHEAGILKLDNNRAKLELDWHPKLSFDETISWTANWYKHYLNEDHDMKEYSLEQIKAFSI